MLSFGVHIASRLKIHAFEVSILTAKTNTISGRKHINSSLWETARQANDPFSPLFLQNFPPLLFKEKIMTVLFTLTKYLDFTYNSLNLP